MLARTCLLLSAISFLANGCALNYLEVSGSVQDAVTGETVGGAKITLVACMREYSNVTDEEGKFSIRYWISYDQYRDMSDWLLTAHAEGYSPGIMPMFRHERFFGYLRLRGAKFELTRTGESGSKWIFTETPYKDDPLAHPEAIWRLHYLSRLLYIDSTGARGMQIDKLPSSLAAHLVADRSRRVRREAARVAWRFRSPEVIHALLLALDDEDADVRYFASRSLPRTGGGGVIYRYDSDEVRGKKTAAWWKWYERRPRN